MSVFSPRDFSSISRPEDAEVRILPASLAAPAKTYTPATTDGNEAPRASALSRIWSIREAINLDEPPAVGGTLKRVFDIVVSASALLLLAPVLLLVAGAVKLFTGGEVIFRHRRVGLNGRYFSCLKFRTMVPNGDDVLRRHLETNPAAAEEWRLTRKLNTDPRITPIGRVLRKTSLDELPQLLNILRGEMSCVGPRPIVADELPYYGEHVVHYLQARPGVTGLWQVSGRSLLSYRERVEFDIRYVREWSLFADIAIIARTIPAVFKMDQAG